LTFGGKVLYPFFRCCILGCIDTAYGGIIDRVLEQHAKGGHYVTEKRRDIAEKLGFLKGGPHDVFDISRSVLKQRTDKSMTGKAQVYVVSRHLFVLELKGFLFSFFRNYAEIGGKGMFRLEVKNPEKGDEHDYVPA